MDKLMKLFAAILIGITATYFVGCSTLSPNAKSSITQSPFGRTADGHAVEIYTLRNAQGTEARIMTYGGIVQSLSVPDKHGQLADVVLGYDQLQGYLDKNPGVRLTLSVRTSLTRRPPWPTPKPNAAATR